MGAVGECCVEQEGVEGYWGSVLRGCQDVSRGLGTEGVLRAGAEVEGKGWWRGIWVGCVGEFGVVRGLFGSWFEQSVGVGFCRWNRKWVSGQDEGVE